MDNGELQPATQPEPGGPPGAPGPVRTGPGVCEPGTGLRFYATRPLRILREVRREDLPADVVAGFTIAAVLIPQAIAYASIAELPAHYGLYTAAIAAIVGSLWGCSRFLATGPVNATSLLVLPALLATAVPDTPTFLLAASLLAVMAGLLRVLLAALHFGAVVTLASRSVLLGFAAGAAIHIAIGQARHLLGLDMPAMPELHRTIAALIAAAGETNRSALLLGLGTLAGVVVLRRAGGARFPAALVSIAAASVAVWWLGLEEQGVRVVGAIPRTLPAPTWIATGMLPDLEMIRSLAVDSMAVAALGLIEAVAASQTLARRAGDRLDPNQEFFGQGLANIAAGLFSGYPCSGSFTRSALAHQSGARTHLAGVFTGIIVLLGMLAFAPLARWIPRSAIAGVLLVVAWRMIDRSGIRRVLRTSRTEAAIMSVTFVATLVLPLDFAVLAGVMFSLAFFVLRSSLPRVVPVVPDPTYRHLVDDPGRPACPQLGILNIRGPLFFGAVHHVEEELRHNREQHPGQHFLVLRMHGVDICDLTGIEMLESTVKDYRRMGGDVFLVRPRKPVLEMMEKSGFLDDTLGRDHVLAQEGAIEHLFENVLDPSVCIYECEHRVFAECQALEKHPYDADLPPAPVHLHLHDRLVPLDRFQQIASDERTLVIDVREREEYRRGHIPGATHLPLRMLMDKGPSLPRDRRLLLCCRSGRRSSRAMYVLEDLGFSNVHGLRGGFLAWQAANLPASQAHEAEAADPAVGPLAVSEDAGRERRMLALLRLRRRSAELRETLDLLGSTAEPSALREVLERLLDQAAPPPGRPAGCVRLDSTRPVLIVSGLHGHRRAFRKLLLHKYVGEASNLDSVLRGELQLLLLGDLLHTENRERWETVRAEYAAAFAPEAPEAGPTPAMDEEMTDSFGLAAMVMTLQAGAGWVHCLKGNHDNLLDAEGRGNRTVANLVADPGEGRIARAWTLLRFGSAFAGKYAAWENRLPVFAIHESREDGLRFVASHTEPAEPYDLRRIEERPDDVVAGLTWTRNRGAFAPDVLRSVFGRDWKDARYFVSHTGSQDGVIQYPESNLIVLDRPRSLVAALVLPDSKEFEVHIVA